MPFLEISGLSKHFGGVWALERVHFCVRQGEILGVIGPNGAGKTTLFNVMSGTFPPTKGKIVYKGQELTGMKLHQVAAKGVVRSFQATTLYPEMTAFESVAVSHHLSAKVGFWHGLFHTRKARNERRDIEKSTADILAFTGLTSLGHHLAKRLPYGHQRLLSFAVALAADPEVLLLDEPMAGMNAGDVSAALEMMKKIRNKGVTTVLVEHNMRAIMSICDRIVVLSFGRKIAEGSPDEIREDPEVIKAYLGVGEDIALD